MKQPRYLHIVAAIVACALLAAACGDSGDAEPAATTVAPAQASGATVPPTPDLSGVTLKIGVQAASTSAAIEASGALKGAAYKVEFATFTGPTPIMAALQAGQLDAGHIGDYSLVVAQAAADPPWTATNVPFKMFYVYGWADPVNFPQIVTLVGKNSGIKTLADIKGKKFSYTVGGQTNLQYLYTLKKAGLKPSDVTPVQLDFAVGATALAGGDVDVWAGPITNAQEALASGARLLVTGPEVGTTTLGGYVARTPLLDDPVKGAALRDFASRLVTYQKWVIEHPDDEAKIFVTVQKQTPERATTSAIYARQLVVLPDDAAMVKRAQEVADDLFEYGLVKTKVDVTLGYDARYKSTIEQALKDTDFATVLAKGNAEAAAKNFAGAAK